MDQNKNQEIDPAKEQKGQLKKLLDSHMLILEHRLGQPPSMDQLLDFLNEGVEEQQNNQTAVVEDPSQLPGNKPQEPSQEIEDEEHLPKILSTKIYYGMSGEGEDRKPDPNKVLFYKSPDDQWYDTGSQEWFENEPNFASHLPSRDINFNDKDIVTAMAHGVLDDEDFDALDQAGMITEMPRQLWAKMQQLQALHQNNDQMSKSENPLEEPDEDSDEENIGGEEESTPEDTPEDEDSTPEDSENDIEEEGEPGEDLIAQIMEAALSTIDTNLEQKVTEIVTRLLQNAGFIEAEAGETGEDADEN